MDRTTDDHSRRPLINRAVDEARHLAVLFLYLWVLFGLFVLNERIILSKEGISFTSYGFAIINALVLAKVMLIFEHLDLGRFAAGRPLIYKIVFESFLLSILFICFHVIEHAVIGVIQGESLQASIPAIGGGGYIGLASVALILFIALIPFFAFRNIGRELGAGRLNTMLFGAAAKSSNDKL